MLRVLIVDDEKNIRLSLAAALRDLGVSLTPAETGEEALHLIKFQVFDLVFLDLNLPGIGGLDVLRALKRSQPGGQVVIMSGSGTIKNAVQAIKLGAVDFIQKPFGLQEFMATINVLMKKVEGDQKLDFEALIEKARHHIGQHELEIAETTLRQAIGNDPSRPESFNLLGAIKEIKGFWIEAQKFYRAAMDLNPCYKPATLNLERVTSLDKTGKIFLGDSQEQNS